MHRIFGLAKAFLPILVTLLLMVFWAANPAQVAAQETPSTEDALATIQAMLEAINTPTPELAPAAGATPEAAPPANAAPNIQATVNAMVQEAVMATVSAMTAGGQLPAPSGDAPPAPTATATPAPQTVEVGNSALVIMESIPLESNISSDHPYSSNEDSSWYINNSTGLNAMRIHFPRIELEEDVDYLVIQDADEDTMQIITGKYPDGLWSDVVPGIGAYIRLFSDGADERWGFEADALAAVPHTTLGYSAHPYYNGTDNVQTFVSNEANPSGTAVEFGRIELEDGVDYILIEDVDGNPYQWITGDYPDGFTSVAVPGSVVQVHLVTDSSVRGWGYDIARLVSAEAEKPNKPPVRDSIADSPHPFSDAVDKVLSIKNPDPEATSSKIHFDRISFNDDCDRDYLEVLDIEDTVIATYCGYGLEITDHWSASIPGQVVKLHMVSNGNSYSGWGFRVDDIVNSVDHPGIVQSDHPAWDSFEQTWTIMNPDPKALSSKIHFDRISFDDDCDRDYLEVLDSKDTVIETYCGYDLEMTDHWSEYIPGRLVKLRMVSNGTSYYGWGFRVDDIVNSIEHPGIVQSDHPAWGSFSKTWTIMNPDPEATSSKIHFDRISFDDDCDRDYLEVLDSEDTVIETYCGYDLELSDHWSESIPGRNVKLRMVSSGNSYYGWGFRVDRIITPD